MNRRERLVGYVRESVDPNFDPAEQLIAILDSVSLLQLIMFIDQEFGITLDLSDLGIDMFTTVETVVAALETIQPEQQAA